MALSGSFHTNVGSYWRVRCSWSGSQSISGNYTDITMNVYWESTSSAGTTYTSTTKNGSATIDGTTSNFTFSAKLSGQQSKLVKTHTKRVYHGSDGKKSISMSASLSIEMTLSGTYYGAVTASSGTVTLDTIPRTSSVSSNVSWTAGTQNLAISVSRASSSFTHLALIYVQNPSGTWEYIGETPSKFGTSTTMEFNSTHITRMYQALALYENRPAKVVLRTYSGSTHIGSSERTGTVYGHKAGTISFNDFNIGDSVPATVGSYNSIFTYNVSFTFGSFKKTFSNVGQYPTFTWTAQEAQDMFAQIPTAKSGWGGVSCSTYYNGVLINEATTKSYNAYVVNSNPIFDASKFTYADTYTTTANLTGNNQYIIQNMSNLTVYLNSLATAQNKATISRYVVTVNGKEHSFTATGNHNFGTISAGTDQTLTVKVIDSRGFETVVSKNIPVIPYSNPSLAITANRKNKFEDETTLKVNGTFSTITVGTTPKNSLVSFQYRYKQKGASTWTRDWTNIGKTVSGGKVTGVDIILQLLNTQNWDVEVKIQDSLTTIVNTIVVGTGQPILFIDSSKKSVGVGKFPTENDSFEVNGNVFAGEGYFYEGGHFNADSSVNGNLQISSLSFNNSSAVSHDAYGNVVGGGGAYYRIYNNSGSPILSLGLNTEEVLLHPNASLEGAKYGRFDIESVGFIELRQGNFGWFGSETDTQKYVDYGQIRIKGNNNHLQIGLDYAGNSRRAYISVGHSDPNYAQYFGQLHLQVKGGDTYCGGNLYAKSYANSSRERLKTDISVLDKSALEIIRGTKLYKYKLKEDIEQRRLAIAENSEAPPQVKEKFGVIIERETPEEIIGADGDSVDLYSMVSLAWKAIQELTSEVKYLKIYK